MSLAFNGDIQVEHLTSLCHSIHSSWHLFYFYDVSIIRSRQSRRHRAASALVQHQRRIPLPWTFFRRSAVPGNWRSGRRMDADRLGCHSIFAMVDPVAAMEISRSAISLAAAASRRVSRCHEQRVLSGAGAVADEPRGGNRIHRRRKPGRNWKVPRT